MRHLYRKFFLITFFVSMHAEAATPLVSPNLFDAGVTEKTLATQKFALPGVSGPIKTQEQPSQEIANADKIHFKLSRVEFSGNTIFSDAQLNEIFAGDFNKTISLADLQNRVQAVTQKYRAAGYVISRAILPPQEIKNGLVKIQVIEGFISNVSVTGNPGRAQALLEKYGTRIEAMHPLNIKGLERYVLLANDLPGYKVQAVITPSKNIPGGADLTLVTTREFGYAATSLDNYGTRYLGPNQITFMGDLYSFLTPGDDNRGRVVVTTQATELRFGELIHAQPIGSDGLKVAVDVNYTETHPSFTLTPFNIVGRSFSAYADMAYPVIRSRTKNFFVHGVFNYQNVTSLLLSAPFYQDRFRTLQLGGVFENIDSYRGINVAGLDVEHGFPIWGAHDHLNQSRPNGQTPFNKLNLNLSRLQGLNERFSLFGGFEGQYTRYTLLATEQFGFGGPEFGRGYDPVEIIGDRGVGGKLELRADTWPQLRFLQTVQYYTFYDAGVVWNWDNINLPGKQSATSAGVGARINFMDHVWGNFYLAKPLTRSVATQILLGRDPKAVRGFFQVMVDV